MLGLLAGTPLSALVPKCLPEPRNPGRYVINVGRTPITAVSFSQLTIYTRTPDGLFEGKDSGQGMTWRKIDRIPFVFVDI